MALLLVKQASSPELVASMQLLIGDGKGFFKRSVLQFAFH